MWAWEINEANYFLQPITLHLPPADIANQNFQAIKFYFAGYFPAIKLNHWEGQY